MNREEFVADYLRPPRDGENERDGDGENERDGDEDGRDGENVGREGETEGRDGVVEVVVDGRDGWAGETEGREGETEGRDGWAGEGETEGRDGVVEGVARVSTWCVGRLGDVVACVSGDAGRVTGRLFVGFVWTARCGSPVLVRVGRASGCVAAPATRRAAIAFVRAWAVVLRWANATARASGLARRSGTAVGGTFASASVGDAGRYARGLCPAELGPDEPTAGRAGR